MVHPSRAEKTSQLYCNEDQPVSCAVYADAHHQPSSIIYFDKSAQENSNQYFILRYFTNLPIYKHAHSQKDHVIMQFWRKYLISQTAVVHGSQPVMNCGCSVLAKRLPCSHYLNITVFQRFHHWLTNFFFYLKYTKGKFSKCIWFILKSVNL